MAQAAVFPDAQLVALALLRASAIPEAAAATYGTIPPDVLGDDFPGVPYVTVTVATTDTSWHPYRETVTLQLTAWESSEARAKRLVQVARAVLVSHAEDDSVSSISAGRRGPLSATDPDSGLPMAFADVDVRLLPEVLWPLRARAKPEPAPLPGASSTLKEEPSWLTMF